jgi:hypothetical protein
VPVGEGIVGNPAFFAALHQASFDDFVIYGMCSALLGGGSIGNLDRYSRRFVGWMQLFR